MFSDIITGENMSDGSVDYEAAPVHPETGGQEGQGVVPPHQALQQLQALQDLPRRVIECQVCHKWEDFKETCSSSPGQT